ncbi:hypothetical protein NA56DRAFT_708813 [Hyaloscypha hepaticicola]|uniref:Uncharacterized protein n=1 Tax=Hyaloscypha hepaticicola TaxID=2082293 RepID=A0A2J6PRC3_9HELO|nr:hypothetical protein NA56DRAFT_708813 [Hyaloscypha hepaticicola]
MATSSFLRSWVAAPGCARRPVDCFFRTNLRRSSKGADCASGVGEFYGPILWNQIVLQASGAEESIRHSAISIGALDMTTLFGKKAKLPEGVAEQIVFALRQ